MKIIFKNEFQFQIEFLKIQLDSVEEFMKVSGQFLYEQRKESFVLSDIKDIINLRYSLINEEFNELLDGIQKLNKREVLDALIDLYYVNTGAFLTLSEHLDIINNYKKFCNDLIKEINEESEIYSDTIFSLENFKKNIIAFKNIIDSDSFLIGYSNDFLKALQEVITYIDFNIKFFLNYFEFTNEQIIEAFKKVHDSNMSKFCKSEEEAVLTIEEYKKKNIETYYKQVDNYFVVYRKSDNKVLKSINYNPVNLDEFI